MTKNWEQEKERLRDLYMARRLKLSTVSHIMAQEYGFQASERAYKQKFKEWKWFKKTPRQRSPNMASTDHDLPLPNGDGHLYRIQPHGVHRPVRSSSVAGMPHLDHHYPEQYAHMPVAKYEPDAYSPEMGYAPQQQHHHHLQHHHHPQHHQNIGPVSHPTATAAAAVSSPGMTLGPYQGRGQQHQLVSPLPSVTHLQHAALKEYLREVERRLEMSQYDQAETACENALRTLRWLKDNRATGVPDGL